METVKNKLWTRDFTILTLGTVVSMLGNAVAGFAIGLLVLDKTDSVMLYALFMVCYSLPRIVLPMIAGPYLDRFSRKRVIYTLDFISAGLFAVFFLLLLKGYFNYTAFLLMSMVIGSAPTAPPLLETVTSQTPMPGPTMSLDVPTAPGPLSVRV